MDIVWLQFLGSFEWFVAQPYRRVLGTWVLQGYLAYKKPPHPLDHHRSLGMRLL